MGFVLAKLDCLRVGLINWDRWIRKTRIGLKKKLSEKLDILLEEERSDNNLVDIINTKIQLNGEIEKEEVFLEQRVMVNWLKNRDKNTLFFYK